MLLVVDDDLDTCQNLSDILTDLGYEVETAHDPRAALERVRQRPYDVALLDLKMPGMDGLTLYREIKKVRPQMVALIVTAFAGAGTDEDAARAGAWKVLAKPIEFSVLLPLIDEAVRQPLVLVVDDDHDLCQNLWDLLRDRGYRVALAHDAREAVASLHDGDYRVVLIDMRLPHGDGGEVFRAVRRSHPEARVVMMTGYAAELDHLLRQVMADGADAVCYKPFNVPELLETMQRLTKEP